MLQLYKNKKKTFEAKLEIQIDGSSYNNAKSRLIFSPDNDNRNIFFEGKIESGICKIPVIFNLDLPHTGKVMLEVIIDEENIFKPWESTYEILTEQVKVQTENIILISEDTIKSRPVVKLIETAEIKPATVIPTIKRQEDIIEKPIIKFENKTPNLFLESCSNNNKEIVNTFLQTINSLNKPKRKPLLEFITKEFKPKNKSKNWAKEIFLEQNSVASKISMYCYEMSTGKING